MGPQAHRFQETNQARQSLVSAVVIAVAIAGSKRLVPGFFKLGLGSRAISRFAFARAEFAGQPSENAHSFRPVYVLLNAIRQLLLAQNAVCYQAIRFGSLFAPVAAWPLHALANGDSQRVA